MKRYILFLTLILVALLSADPASAKEWKPEEMVNPNIANRYEYVADPDGLMDEATKAEVNRRLYDLRKRTSVELMVAVPSGIGDMPIEEWCEKLFTSWGIGKKDKDNGVLLVIAPEQHRTFIMTGYGVEGVLPDISCSNIIGKTVIPNMKEGNLNGAVDEATSLLYDALTDPSVAGELKSKQADNYAGNLQTLSPDVIWDFVMIVAMCVWLFALGAFMRDLYTGRKYDNYQRAQLWKRHLKIYFWLSVLSAGSGLLFFLLAWIIYRRTRTRKIKCPTCGAKMHRLGEEEDNELLNDSQDFEERINTVDYDVWECDKCGTVERFPFKIDQSKYTECPNCHTVAMCLVEDRITVPPTVQREGVGEKIYECQFCHHRKSDRYRLPKKEDPTAALLAGAVIGSALGGRGGGGGGFGGGLGGGATGGGGAGGSW